VTVELIQAILLAFAIVVILTPAYIRLMRWAGFAKQIRMDGPESHQIKEGTPTAGGALLIGVVGALALLFNLVDASTFAPLAALGLVGVLGFADDWLNARTGDGIRVRVGRHVPAADHDEPSVGEGGGEATAVDRLDELVVFALDYDGGRGDGSQVCVDLRDHAVGGELLAGERFEVSARHVDGEHTPAVGGDDGRRVERFAVGAIDGHGCEQLRERGVGELADDGQLQDLHEVGLDAVEAAEVHAGGGRVDEHESLHLAGVALGEPERDRAAVGMPDEDRARDVQRVQQFVDRLDLGVEGDVAAG